MNLDDWKWVAIFALVELGIIGLAVWKTLHDEQIDPPSTPHDPNE
jgi:hypothetical protein